MQRFLRQLYSLSLSVGICPLESYIASVVSQVPLPYPGGRSLHVCLDAALVSPNSRYTTYVVNMRIFLLCAAPVLQMHGSYQIRPSKALFLSPFGFRFRRSTALSVG